MKIKVFADADAVAKEAAKVIAAEARAAVAARGRFVMAVSGGTHPVADVAGCWPAKTFRGRRCMLSRWTNGLRLRAIRIEI